MVYDDVSDIPTQGCNVLNNQDTLYNYSGNVRTSFIQVGGRWIKTRTDNYSSIPSGYACIDVRDLSSNAHIVPLLYMCSFGLFLVCVWLFFLVIRKMTNGTKI